MRYGTTVFGNHHTTRAVCESLIRDGLKPDLLVTLSAEARAKVEIAGGSDGLADWARSAGIAVHECRGYRLISDADRAFFAENEFDLGLCTDWQHLLRDHVLEAFPSGVFGFHGSLMRFPNGRGRAPFNWSLRLGGRSVFHNCFRYSAGADEGAVFNTTEIPIGPEDQIADLRFKALIDTRLTFSRLVRAHTAAELALTRQPESAAIWLPKLTPEDSYLQFAVADLQTLVDMVRASSRPFAGAYGKLATGEIVRIWRARRYDGPTDSVWATAPCGTVVAAATGQALIVCRGGLFVATDMSVPAESLEGAQFV